jgi:uncharacterized delta-60 repeat protein/uncharacterized repeat protein (TIGR01451 family)
MRGLLKILFIVTIPFTFGQNVDLDNQFLHGGFQNNSGYFPRIGMQSNGKLLMCYAENEYFGNHFYGMVRTFSDGTHDTTFNQFVPFCENGFLGFKVDEEDRILAFCDGRLKRLDQNGFDDITFLNTVVNYGINNVALQNDGKILLMGWFTSVNSQLINSLVRLNENGSIDDSFSVGLGTDGSINYAAIQSDGKIIIVGNFTEINGHPSRNIARLNVDGSVDFSFDVGSGATGSLDVVKIQDDGKILFGGVIGEYNGVVRYGIARVNNDGLLDNTFNPSVNSNSINDICLLENNKIVIVGDFSSLSGIERNKIARINENGSVDATFDPLIGFDNAPKQVISQIDGKLLVGGNFTNFRNLSNSHQFVRLNTGTGVFGDVYADFNQNCLKNNFETPISNIALVVQPGNIVVQTDNGGIWHLNDLLPGNYTVTVDTTTSWISNCLMTHSFNIPATNSLVEVQSFGMLSNNPCPSPTVSINMPFMRPCFTNQKIYVQACNEYDATSYIPNAFTIVDLDSNLIFESASIPFTSFGQFKYRFQHDTLFPGECVDFTISVQVSCNVPLGQTLCMEANLYPVDDCVLDSIPTKPTGEVAPCTLPWDRSSLSVEGWCANDSIYFTITNTGELGNGDMLCYSPVRIYIDGVPYLLDSVQLLGGEIVSYSFLGTGETWILQADQHPLHPGNSHPNAHVENCNPGNWTPDLVNDFPQDDADPVVDIYCGVVTGSYDPNDKKGLPNGLTSEHHISPNQDLEYVIHFQNTGTDTAFTVVVRDTLDLDFDIFSVTSGVSSHNYSFRMHGPRVLEWTFVNILLPDSTTNEPLSNGFLTFKVKQKPNLIDGTLLTNKADIYFDFNEPIITNETSHKVQRQIFQVNTLDEKTNYEFSVALYPNPTNGSTVLSFSKYMSDFSYSILDASGRTLVQKSNLYGKHVNIDLKNVPKGIYFVKTEGLTSSKVLKLIVE